MTVITHSELKKTECFSRIVKRGTPARPGGLPGGPGAGICSECRALRFSPGGERATPSEPVTVTSVWPPQWTHGHRRQAGQHRHAPAVCRRGSCRQSRRAERAQSPRCCCGAWICLRRESLCSAARVCVSTSPCTAAHRLLSPGILRQDAQWVVTPCLQGIFLSHTYMHLYISIYQVSRVENLRTG